MILMARWQGPLPELGHFVMSHTRPKFAYRITHIERLKAVAFVPNYQRLKLTVERVPQGDVPDGSIIWGWKWDARKKAGIVTV